MNSAACGVDFFGGSGASKYGNYWRIRWMAVRYPKRQQRARRAIAHYIYYRPRSKSRIIATRRNQYSGVNWCKLFFISLRTSTFTKIKYLLLHSKQCLMITFIKLLLINIIKRIILHKKCVFKKHTEYGLVMEAPVISLLLHGQRRTCISGRLSTS